jgi:hypothetical protein
MKRVETGCKKRWCPVCARKIAAQKVARYELALQRMTWPLFVTLTVRSKEYAAESVRELVEAFFAFRRTKWWKACDVKGGIRGVEITHAAGGWHPHLHLLIDCRWMSAGASLRTHDEHGMPARPAYRQAQVSLTEAWAKATGQDTSIVKVKRADKNTLKEIVKYSIDPKDLVEMEGTAGEAIRCMKGTRATQAWGSCHGIAREARILENKADTGCKCEGCTSPRFMPSVLVDKHLEVIRERDDYGAMQADMMRSAEIHRLASIADDPIRTILDATLPGADGHALSGGRMYALEKRERVLPQLARARKKERKERAG